MNVASSVASEAWIQAGLARLRQQGLERRLTVHQGADSGKSPEPRIRFDFSGNDYLALARHPHVLEASASALRSHGCSASASRLLSGTLPCHADLEERLAKLKGYPAALVLGSGWLANLAAVTAMAGRGDHVFLDRLCHASLVDAALLSKAKLYRFRHNDPQHLAELLKNTTGSGRRLVVTESVFSMDGDVAPLREIANVAVSAGAMILVDEAHATGVLGHCGSGWVRELGLESMVNVSMGTLSKALGGYGGFLACSTQMRNWFINTARSFIFSTALPPAACGAALGALDVLESDPELGPSLLGRANAFRDRLAGAGLKTGASCTQIIPLLIGDNNKALQVAAALKERGVFAPAIRPPTVPAGMARLRLSMNLALSEQDLAEAGDVIMDVMNRQLT